MQIEQFNLFQVEENNIYHLERLKSYGDNHNEQKWRSEC